jgi:hypothetical protein
MVGATWSVEQVADLEPLDAVALGNCRYCRGQSSTPNTLFLPCSVRARLDRKGQHSGVDAGQFSTVVDSLRMPGKQQHTAATRQLPGSDQ